MVYSRHSGRILWKYYFVFCIIISFMYHVIHQCVSMYHMIHQQALKELHIHHLRLLLVICQVSGIVLFPIWMFTDAWELVSAPHNVNYLCNMIVGLNYYVAVSSTHVVVSHVTTQWTIQLWSEYCCLHCPV